MRTALITPAFDKHLGRLGNGPSSRGPVFQDLHALDGGVKRPSMWGYVLEPLVFNGHFLPE
jgi:hypothetical protein